MKRYTPFVVLSLIVACNSQPIKFDGQKAFTYLEKQCALGPRYPGSPGHAALRNMLIDYLKGLCDTLIIQDFDQELPLEHDTVRLTNIIAAYRPDLESKEEPNGLLIGAHWDTRKRADQDEDMKKRNTPIIGANDGASGVAILMHLAEILSQNPPDRPVYLVFFDGEDCGYAGDLTYFCLGSKYFAKHMPIPKPKEAIIVDMVGDADLEIPIERNSINSNPIMVRKLWGHAIARGYKEFIMQIGEEVYDDHVPLIEAGIPSIDIIDFYYPNRFKNYWHTTHDTPDKCSPRSLKVVGQVVLDWIYGAK